MKKKICIFCSLTSFDTGMPISTYRLAAGLAESGRYDVRAALPGEGELAERLTAAGVGVEAIRFNRVRMNPVSMLKFALTWAGAGLRLCGYVKRNGIDIVHFSDVIDAPFYPWAKIAGAKVVGHVRVCAGGSAVKRLYRLWARLFCSRMIAVSKFAKNYYGFCDRRAKVVYNPGPERNIFDANRYPRASLAPAASAALPVILAVASFRRDKGHHNFIKIAAKIKSRLNGNVKFIIAGGKVAGHEKYYDEVMDDARRLGLIGDFDVDGGGGGSLTVTGNVPHEQIPSIMSRSTILLHVPDWEEALGGVVLEAMAMGAAVVAYDCGGVGECFTDGKSGFLVRRGDIDGIVDRALALIGDSELTAGVAREARRELDEKFTLANYVGGIEKIYEKP